MAISVDFHHFSYKHESLRQIIYIVHSRDGVMDKAILVMM